jgi:hypothetical protein
VGQLVIKVESMSLEEKAVFPTDLSFWEDLWDQYTNEYSEVVIHCWAEEEEVVNELSEKSFEALNEGLMKVFTVNLNDENRLFFRNYSQDPIGGLKWFTMFFNTNGEEQLEIGQYGAEIIFSNVDEEKAEEIKAIFPISTEMEYHDDFEE